LAAARLGIDIENARWLMGVVVGSCAVRLAKPMRVGWHEDALHMIALQGRLSCWRQRNMIYIFGGFRPEMPLFELSCTFVD
jgi:hypothetical protein